MKTSRAIVVGALISTMICALLFAVSNQDAAPEASVRADAVPLPIAQEGPVQPRVAFCSDRAPSAAQARAEQRTEGLRAEPVGNHTGVWTTYPDARAWVRQTKDAIPLTVLVRYDSVLDNRSAAGRLTQRDARHLTAFLDELESSGRLVRADGMLTFPYTDSIPDVPAPYISSMSQGALLRLYATAYRLGGRPSDLRNAEEVLRSFEVDVSSGGVLWHLDANAATFEEYATPIIADGGLLHVLNGFLYAMHTVAKVLELGVPQINDRLNPLYLKGVNALESQWPEYETGYDWTYYDLTGENRATSDYHTYQSALLLDLACRERSRALREVSLRWLKWYWERNPIVAARRPTNSQWLIMDRLRGTYPHPYLSEEQPTLLEASGRPATWTPRSRWRSPEPLRHYSWNWGVTRTPKGAKSLTVRWSGMAGLPNGYRIARFSIPAARSTVAGVRIESCDRTRIRSMRLVAWGQFAGIGELPAHRGDCLIATPEAGRVPARVALGWSGRFTAGFLASAYKADRDGATISVDGAWGPAAEQRSVLLSWDVSDLDLQENALLSVPLSTSSPVTATFNVTTEDGRSLSRYLPTPSGRLTKATPITTFLSSVPGYVAGDRIKVVDVRLSFAEPPPKSLRMGQAEVLCGSAGLMSSVRATPASGGTWRLVPTGRQRVPMYADFTSDAKCFDLERSD